MIFYHGTSEELWNEIQKEGVLYGRRYITDNDGNIIKEVNRCTYLAVDREEAECYGDVILEVDYNPYNKRGNIRKVKGKPTNNYIEDCWQIRVYEPISLDNVKRIK